MGDYFTPPSSSGWTSYVYAPKVNDGRGRRCTQFGICKGAPMFGRRGIREELKKRKKKKIPTAMFVLMSFQKHGAFCVLWGHTYVMSAY